MRQDADKMFVPGAKPKVEKESRERQSPGFTFDPKVSAKKKIQSLNPQSGLVKAWSISALKVFEKCPYQIYLRGVKKIKTEGNEFSNRGIKVHDDAEKFVDGSVEKPSSELKNFKSEFAELRLQYGEGKVMCEDDWGYNVHWNPTGWMASDVWLRMKLDAMVFEDETSAKIIDYKTGKKFGNELTHGQQAILYAIGAFQRFPKLEFVSTDFWYLDLKTSNTNPKEFTRKQAELFRPRIHQRALKLTTCTHFLPKPSKSNCKWCPYGKGENGTGDCEWAEE